MPEGCVKSAIAAIQLAMKAADQQGKQIKPLIKSVLVSFLRSKELL